MGVLKNDVGRPSNKTIMIRTILKALGLLLVIGLCFVGGYYLRDKKNDNNESTTKNDSSNKQNKVLTEDEITKKYGILFGVSGYNPLNYNSTEYKVLNAANNSNGEKKSADFVKTNFGLPTNIYGDNNAYGNNSYEYKVDEEVMIITKTEGTCYSYNEINKTYKKLYGNSKDIDKQDYVIWPQLFKYSKSADMFLSATLLWGDGGHTPMTILANYEEKGDKLYIDVYYSDSEFEDDDQNILTLTDGSKVILSNKEVIDKTAYEKYYDKLPKYRFEYFKEDGVYKFSKVTKIKY